jgi:hypothetical protein
VNHDNPSTHVPDGHDGRGRFAKGNKLGKGNPLAGRAAKIRSRLLKAATSADVDQICKALVEGAKAGDLAFIREWLDRTVGKAVQADLLERIEAIESALAARERESNLNGSN